MNRAFFIMGVSGCGKSTIAQLLSKEMDIPYFDGDDFHPEFNVAKMASGQPLNDDDRQGWLEVLNELAKTQLKTNSCIIVCSALKEKYRNTLSKTIEGQVKWIHLSGDFNLISKRLNNRKDHFMTSQLLQSQFETLEIPSNALKVDINLSPQDIVEHIKNELMNVSEFGLFGLGVMGKSLCRNLAKNGFRISMYNRHVDNVDVDVAKHFKAQYSELKDAEAYDDIAAFVTTLQKPRCIMLMVNAGKTIDYVIEDLLPHLSDNDILIDGGNSNYKKTKERYDYLKSKKVHFIGAGVSGGEKGALNGPSIMPSGDKAAYDLVKPYLETIAAKDTNGSPCCTYVGPHGSGHFIKMVHNGIEYVEMQLLAEVTTILEAQGLNPNAVAETLENWKNTANSYLLDITTTIFKVKEDDDWLVKKILDKAGNKDTGYWTTIASAELGLPSTLIASALFSRYISFFKEERVELNGIFKSSEASELNLSSKDILEAYQFARIINHYQGFKLIDEASKVYGWNLNLSEIARIWTSGCIIKSDLMQDLVSVFKVSSNVLKDSDIVASLEQYKPSVKNVVSQALQNDLSTPALSEALQFFNGITTAYASANVIQAQRDFFGAHTYKRLDDQTDKSYHTNWEQLTK